MTYDYIVNPESGRKVSLFTSKGKSILKNYLSQAQMGGAPERHYQKERHTQRQRKSQQDYTKRKETVRLHQKDVVKVEIDGDLCALLRKVFVINVNQLKLLEVLEVQVPNVNTKTHIIINDIMALAVLQNVQKTTQEINEVKNGVNNMKLNVDG